MDKATRQAANFDDLPGRTVLKTVEQPNAVTEDDRRPRQRQFVNQAMGQSLADNVSTIQINMPRALLPQPLQHFMQRTGLSQLPVPTRQWTMRQHDDPLPRVGPEIERQHLLIGVASHQQRINVADQALVAGFHGAVRCVGIKPGKIAIRAGDESVEAQGEKYADDWTIHGDSDLHLEDGI